MLPYGLGYVEIVCKAYGLGQLKDGHHVDYHHSTGNEHLVGLKMISSDDNVNYCL